MIQMIDLTGLGHSLVASLLPQGKGVDYACPCHWPHCHSVPLSSFGNQSVQGVRIRQVSLRSPLHLDSLVTLSKHLELPQSRRTRSLMAHLSTLAVDHNIEVVQSGVTCTNDRCRHF